MIQDSMIQDLMIQDLMIEDSMIQDLMIQDSTIKDSITQRIKSLICNQQKEALYRNLCREKVPTDESSHGVIITTLLFPEYTYL